MDRKMEDVNLLSSFPSSSSGSISNIAQGASFCTLGSSCMSICTDCVKSNNELVNALVFPGSLMESSYKPDHWEDSSTISLVYIPVNSRLSLNLPSHVPGILCMKEDNDASIFVIHFHSNACDIGHCRYCSTREVDAFDANYLVVEYPRYGFAAGHPSEDAINAIAIATHNFVVNKLMVKTSRIVLYGRSIGTGPTCHLASYLESIGHPPAAVMLHSPFSSLNGATADILGCLNFIMLDRFENWWHLIRFPGKNDSLVIKSPVLFLHADRDRIVDYEHSRVMHDLRLKSGLVSVMHTQESTDDYSKGHNFFDHRTDIVEPCKSFLQKYVSSGMEKSYRVDMSAVRKAMLVPADYTHILDHTTGTGVEPSKSYSPWFICRMFMCPCAFCCETSLACPVTCCVLAGKRFAAVQPTFEYPTRRMRGLPFNTVYGILKKLIQTGSLADIIEEEGRISPVERTIRNPLQVQSDADKAADRVSTSSSLTTKSRSTNSDDDEEVEEQLKDNNGVNVSIFGMLLDTDGDNTKGVMKTIPTVVSPTSHSSSITLKMSQDSHGQYEGASVSESDDEDDVERTSKFNPNNADINPEKNTIMTSGNGKTTTAESGRGIGPMRRRNAIVVV